MSIGSGPIGDAPIGGRAAVCDQDNLAPLTNLNKLAFFGDPCCCFCTAFIDEFTDNSLAAYYVQLAGSWLEASEHIETTDADAILYLCTDRESQGWAVSADVSATVDGDKLRLNIGGHGPRLVAEIEFFSGGGTLKLFGTDGTEVASVSVTATTSTTYRMRICSTETRTDVYFGVPGTTPIPKEISALTPGMFTNRIGLETSFLSGTATFDTLIVEEIDEDCPCQNPPPISDCSFCESGSAAVNFSVTLQGLTAGTTAGCPNLNDTWLLTRRKPPNDESTVFPNDACHWSCEWTDCGDFTNEVDTISVPFSATGRSLYKIRLQFFTNTISGEYFVSVTLAKGILDPTVFASYVHSFGFSAPNCEDVGTLVIPLTIGNSPCTYTSSTCTIEVVPESDCCVRLGCSLGVNMSDRIKVVVTNFQLDTVPGHPNTCLDCGGVNGTYILDRVPAPLGKGIAPDAENRCYWLFEGSSLACASVNGGFTVVSMYWDDGPFGRHNPHGEWVLSIANYVALQQPCPDTFDPPLICVEFESIGSYDCVNWSSQNFLPAFVCTGDECYVGFTTGTTAIAAVTTL